MDRTSPARFDTQLEGLLRESEPGGSDMSLIDLVLFACDLSEDAGEINDLVESAIESGAARILPRACDPMMNQLETATPAVRAA